MNIVVKNDTKEVTDTTRDEERMVALVAIVFTIEMNFRSLFLEQNIVILRCIAGAIVLVSIEYMQLPEFCQHRTDHDIDVDPEAT